VLPLLTGLLPTENYYQKLGSNIRIRLNNFIEKLALYL
jgi:hypothetical protein